jgi:hypothetical protein
MRRVSDRGALDAEPLRWFLVATSYEAALEMALSGFFIGTNPKARRCSSKCSAAVLCHKVSGIVGARSLP